ncbi:S-adenosyl-L-methionine-dependent methyltransferase, partial [Coniochaeta ligniaria NRRL 30616]
QDPALYEQTHVHSVYSSIAPHFSATRHKPWPRVAQFLLSQPPGSVGLDVGCGNGKYMSVNPAVYLIGSDRSGELVRLARDGGEAGEKREVLTADGLALPFRGEAVDFVICVAVVHHFSTRERRVEGIRGLLGCVRPTTKGKEDGGKVLVYVWALEQGDSRRGWDEGAEQDQLVPWKETEEKEKEKTYQRYYHLYRKGELEEDFEAAGGVVLESGYERDNWWVVAANV